MPSLRVVSGIYDVKSFPKMGGLKNLITQEALFIEADKVLHHWISDDKDHYYIIGDVDGSRQSGGKLMSSSSVKIETDRLSDPMRVSDFEGRFVVLKISPNGVCQLWTDQFGRIDLYWQQLDGAVVLATSMDLLPVASSGASLDNIGIAHSLTVYGSRPAKKHTIYSSVKRLGVGESIELSGGSVKLTEKDFKPVNSAQYQECDLHHYADVFLESLRSRAGLDGNVVYLSSGWDSTSILAGLVHLFGNRKVRAVIGRMRYAERSGIINQFEIDRAHAVADYFGVRLDVIELDYRNAAEEVVSKLQPLFRSQQFANLTGFNHWLLAEGVAKTANSNEVIFAGEMSDGAHNLGFSQFVSIFHPASYEFREYSDKMAGYLFGPTFLGQMQKGVHEQDPVWQIFRQKNPKIKLDKIASTQHGISKQMLGTFFLSGGRMPLYSMENGNILSADGREKFASESEESYINKIAAKVNTSNLYSCYLHLYNSFHWQGATVATLEHTAEANGLRCVAPFHDAELMDFLSAMPESWGRGLDLNPTKYPLKWMLRNKINYPNHLQVGPHAYTYDVNPNFTLTGEILYASSFKDIFKRSLQSGKLIGLLDEEFFNHQYIDKIVNQYVQGEELAGQEMKDLSVLAMHSLIGVYG